MPGHSHSPETRAKLSAAAKRRPASAYAWTAERRAKLSATNKRLGRKPPVCKKGWKKSDAACAKLRAVRATETWRSEASKSYWKRPEYRAKMASAFRDKPSALELKMRALLDVAGVDYVFQFPVPGTGYVADFYLPRTNAVVEVDGERWHAMRTEYDERRDDEIRALGFRVVRLSSRAVWRDETTALEMAVA